MQINLTWEEFEEQFKPIPNREEFNGCLFETYGQDMDRVFKALWENRETVWTIYDNDDMTVGEGYHLVNRFGHIITEVPYEPGTSYTIN